MKTLATLSLISIFTSSIAFAGGFGGPGPFRNESSLPSGTDGTYNASLRGPNLSGVFRFQISSGTQSADILNPLPAVPSGIYSARGNSWVAWYEGIVYRGLTDASIFRGSVAGVLDPLVGSDFQRTQPNQPSRGNEINTVSIETVTNIPEQQLPGNVTIDPYTITRGYERNTQGAPLPALSPPLNLITPPAVNSTLMGGQFSGTIKNNSPTGNMSGAGKFTVVENSGTITADGGGIAPNQQQFTSKDIKFRWRGARVDTGS